MKTLTAMTAIVALIAGISVASAQNSTKNDQTAPPASINKGSLATPQSGDQKMNPAAKHGTTGSGVGMNPAQEATKKNVNPGTQNPANGAEKEK